MAQQQQQQIELLDRYQILAILGEGGFGKVLHAVDRTRQTQVAIKIIELTDIEQQKKISTQHALGRHLLTEMRSHYQATAHPNIVALHKVYHQTFNRQTGGTGHRLAVVIELAHGGNLLAHYNALRQMAPGINVSESRVRWFFQQYVSALDFVHSQGIVHRDIKLENTLIEANPMTADTYPSIKMCDFGLSKIVEDGVAQSNVGTPEYKAPEVFNNQTYVASKADVWSLGVMLYIMLAGSYPFQVNGNIHAHNQALNSTEHWAGMWQALQQKGRSAAVISLVQAMLQVNPDDRISLGAIKQNEWFNTNRAGNPRAKLTGEEGLQLRNPADLCEQTLEEILAITESALTQAGIPIIHH